MVDFIGSCDAIASRSSWTVLRSQAFEEEVANMGARHLHYKTTSAVSCNLGFSVLDTSIPDPTILEFCRHQAK